MEGIGNDRRKASAKIAKLTQEYLDRGGVITVVPSTYCTTHNKPWIAESENDYTPWTMTGSHMALQIPLGPGCSMTKPAKTL
jgi:hypothetical protein